MSGRVVRDYVLYLAVLTAAWILRWMPLSFALKVGDRLGDAGWWLFPSRREVTLGNLKGAFDGTIPEREMVRLGRAVYRNTGRSVVEFCRFPRLTRAAIARLVDVEGVEHFEQAQAGGKGVLLLSAHLGNWELAGQAHVSLGYPLCAIYRPLSNRFVSRLVNRYRVLHGARPIEEQGSLLAVLKALKRGEGVAVLLDQSAAPGEGVSVDFLGRPAWAYKSLAVVALKSRAPVIPLFLIRQENGPYRLIYGQAVPLAQSGDLHQDIAVNTERFTRIIEAYVRRYPDQWLWMHRRWATHLP